MSTFCHYRFLSEPCGGAGQLVFRSAGLDTPPPLHNNLTLQSGTALAYFLVGIHKTTFRGHAKSAKTYCILQTV